MVVNYTITVLCVNLCVLQLWGLLWGHEYEIERNKLVLDDVRRDFIPHSFMHFSGSQLCVEFGVGRFNSWNGHYLVMLLCCHDQAPKWPQ